MGAIEIKTEYTPEDLLDMPDGEQFELVNGQLVERDVSAISSIVAARLCQILLTFCDVHGLAWVVGSECGYKCFPKHPDRIRRPDVSFVDRDRLPVDRLAEGYVTVAPDLAVEVISPNDRAYDVEEKVQEYLDAGVKLVWVVNPPTRTLLVYRGDGSITGLREADELSGESVLPGFRCRVGELFPAIHAATKQTS
jgi:Uma2 family endonuclease